MDALADRVADDDVGSVFLYTHEAHPGERYPALRSMDQKQAHARALRDVYGVTRPILLDALDGACHRAYGGMPNMTWIFDRRGRVLYKANWTDAGDVGRAIDDLLGLADRRRAGERPVPFESHRVAYRHKDHEGFERGLERSGPKAVAEYHAAFG